ncbi:unnamed protein product [Enterobius vermicularis]|uniref:Endoplasmic reticulum transmembrane protein n=1 Tax=Enterobius vermicularis TaxID=51028 RepID=A0A0N4VEY4_ENTVE|nr:unnamed protein product [Enterobius vermicularis]
MTYEVAFGGSVYMIVLNCGILRHWSLAFLLPDLFKGTRLLYFLSLTLPHAPVSWVPSGKVGEKSGPPCSSASYYLADVQRNLVTICIGQSSLSGEAALLAFFTFYYVFVHIMDYADLVSPLQNSRGEEGTRILPEPIMSRIPGESTDGIIRCLENLREHRRKREQDLAALKSERQLHVEQLERIRLRLESIERDISEETERLEHITSAIQKAESTYGKLRESSQSLLDFLKKECQELRESSRSNRTSRGSYE